MLLLKPTEKEVKTEKQSDLHFTMLLLKHYLATGNPNHVTAFTFHYASIKTVLRRTDLFDASFIYISLCFY